VIKPSIKEIKIDSKRPALLKSSGATMVEFALSLMVFWSSFIVVVEFSRLMFLWGTAGESTQIAARLASICEITSAQQGKIRDEVSRYVIASGQVDLGSRSDWLVFQYFPVGCTAETCTQVEVALNNVSAQLLLPLPLTSISLPSFRTRQSRETLSNAVGVETNDVCD